MKFCENCGTQLADDATFCEECGTKQETKETPISQEEQTLNQNANQVNPQVENPIPKLSETCTPAKREIKDWLMILLLVVCSPLLLFEIIIMLPDFLFWIIYSVAPIAVLILMWTTKKSWKMWIKAAVTAAYLIMFFI